MSEIFADSFYYFALLNSNDAAHERAVQYSQSKTHLIVTGWILTELADGMSSAEHRSLCSQLIASLRKSPKVTVVNPTVELFDAGLAFLREAQRQGLVADGLHFFRGDA